MEKNKPTCFVIQKFDNNGTYDKRYHESIKPALDKANVIPQRADKILGLQPIIEKVERAIQDASICIAEISEDNPNVWLELGYALALNRPTVILCDESVRSRLPFDIQHRPVIFYRTDSKSGYEELEAKIIESITNELDKNQRIVNAPTIKNGSDSIDDLKTYEVSILTTLLALWPTSPDGTSSWELNKKLESIGYSEAALGLGITKLLNKKFLLQENETDFNGQDFFVYRITPAGISWLHDKEDKLGLVKEEESTDYYDDDIPF